MVMKTEKLWTKDRMIHICTFFPPEYISIIYFLCYSLCGRTSGGAYEIELKREWTEEFCDSKDT